MSRAQKVAIAQAMRREGGLTKRQIAAEFGVSRFTVNDWFNDPTHAKLKARKQGYAGKCIDCGKPTNGDHGRGKARVRCIPCAHRQSQIWTRESIIAAIQAFDAQYGRPPSAMDFSPAMLRQRPFSAARQREVDAIDRRAWPNVATVQKQFGSWSNGLRAAGFEPSRGGRPTWR